MGALGDLVKEIEFENEVQAKVEELLNHFDEKFIPHEGRNNWYCGVTGQEQTTDQFELERIKEHHKDDFPKLDEFSIVTVEVSTVEVALEVERIMGDNHGLDNGEKPNPPKDGDRIWVYIFRKG